MNEILNCKLLSLDDALQKAFHLSNNVLSSSDRQVIIDLLTKVETLRRSNLNDHPI